MDNNSYTRRNFVQKGFIITTAAIAGSITACHSGPEEEDVSPAEDLMREHGLLNRVLLIYDYCRIRFEHKEQFPFSALNDSAKIIKEFIEDYHEKLEENFLFPRFEKANLLSDLVAVLRKQHEAGRIITTQLLNFTQGSIGNDTEREKMLQLINSFTQMYRPHEAREDTILFPALKKIISKHEYDALGEDFEKREHKLFGEDGFEHMVDKVAQIEKQLGIYDLSRFTPST